MTAKKDSKVRNLRPQVGEQGAQEQPKLDELTELVRITWCEAFYWLGGGFSFKEDFVKQHLAPVMEQAGVDPEKLEDDNKVKALITFSSYIICSTIAGRLESAGVSKTNPPIYSQALYQQIIEVAQTAFVNIVDDFEFRFPLLPFINVFSQAVYKQELEDIATAYLFGPAYEITLRRALFQHGYIKLPESGGAGESDEETDDTDIDKP